MPDFDLDAALQPAHDWKPWNVYDRIDFTQEALDGGRAAWVERLARYWMKTDGTVLAKADAFDIVRLRTEGNIDMAYLAVPNRPPGMLLLAEVADGYNLYQQQITEFSVAEQWLMVWAFFRSLPGRTSIANIGEEEFRFNFPT